MSLKHEPSSEPLRLSAKKLCTNPRRNQLVAVDNPSVFGMDLDKIFLPVECLCVCVYASLSSLLFSSPELSGTKSLGALDTSPARNRFALLRSICVPTPNNNGSWGWTTHRCSGCTWTASLLVCVLADQRLVGIDGRRGHPSLCPRV